MSLTGVQITEEAFQACAVHALSTEAEEVMGLLLGDVEFGERGEAVARVWVALPQIRVDRRKDRVEASPEQVAQCLAAAEKLSEQSGRRTRVIGWYHSHPHITVHPSHVDIRTQASYQVMDEHFVGLIFSTFNEDSSDGSQKVQVTAFQSCELSRMASTASVGSQEVDSPMARAIAASKADLRAAAGGEGQMVLRDIPMAVVPPMDPSEQSSVSMRALLEVLLQEERAALASALSEAAMLNGGRVDPLTAAHHTGVYQQHLSRVLELVVGPLLGALRVDAAAAAHRADQLEELCHDLRAAPLPRASPVAAPPLVSPAESSQAAAGAPPATEQPASDNDTWAGLVSSVSGGSSQFNFNLPTSFRDIVSPDLLTPPVGSTSPGLHAPTPGEEKSPQISTQPAIVEPPHSMSEVCVSYVDWVEETAVEVPMPMPIPQAYPGGTSHYQAATGGTAPPQARAGTWPEAAPVHASGGTLQPDAYSRGLPGGTQMVGGTAPGQMYPGGTVRVQAHAENDPHDAHGGGLVEVVTPEVWGHGNASRGIGAVGDQAQQGHEGYSYAQGVPLNTQSLLIHSRTSMSDVTDGSLSSRSNDAVPNNTGPLVNTPHLTPRNDDTPAPGGPPSPTRGAPAKTPSAVQFAMAFARFPELPTSARAHLLPPPAPGPPPGSATQGPRVSVKDWDRTRVVVGRGPLASAGSEEEAWALARSVDGAPLESGLAYVGDGGATERPGGWAGHDNASGHGGAVSDELFADLGPISSPGGGPPMVPRG